MPYRAKSKSLTMSPENKLIVLLKKGIWLPLNNLIALFFKDIGPDYIYKRFLNFIKLDFCVTLAL